MTTPTPRVRVVASVAAATLVALVFATQPFAPFGYGGDVWVYLAAGERLNDGHALYALVSGDRHVPLNPPFWTTPLLAPPPVAVIWRPLAAISPVGPALWWASCVVGMVLMTLDLLRRGGPKALVGTVVLAPALALTAASGNANAIVTPLLYLAWHRRQAPGLAGGVIAAAAALKLTPVLGGLWLLAHRRRELSVAVVAGFVGLALSLLGAGVDAHLDWLATALLVQPAPMSLAGLSGVSPVAITAVAAVAVGLVAAFVRRESAIFATSVVAAVLATPAFYFTAIAGLAAALAVDEG